MKNMQPDESITKFETDSYGLNHRFQKACGFIELFGPSRVLDYGCGTGENLTIPLAKHFPKIQFTAFDEDHVSILKAKSHNINNINFISEIEKIETTPFDVIICSEVLEHVKNPGETLNFLNSRLKEAGHLFLTIPNGYGPFEISMFFEALFTLSGLRKVLLAQRIQESPESKDTLAISPHINFFTQSRIESLLKSTGFRLSDSIGRTFICGFLFDKLIQNQKLSQWNHRLSEVLPLFLASGWIFYVEKLALPVTSFSQSKAYKRPFIDNLRAGLFYKRWGLGKFHASIAK